MSKSHRGQGILEKYRRGRGTCPVCKRTGVKTLYSYEHNGKNIEICKVCRAAISHGKKEEALSALA
jgi:hypothetical protein